MSDLFNDDQNRRAEALAEARRALMVSGPLAASLDKRFDVGHLLVVAEWVLSGEVGTLDTEAGFKNRLTSKEYEARLNSLALRETDATPEGALAGEDL